MNTSVVSTTLVLMTVLLSGCGTFVERQPPDLPEGRYVVPVRVEGMAFTLLPDEVELNPVIVGKPISMGTRIITGPESEILVEPRRKMDPSRDIVAMELERGGMLVAAARTERKWDGGAEIKGPWWIVGIRGGGEAEVRHPPRVAVLKGLAVYVHVKPGGLNMTVGIEAGEIFEPDRLLDTSMASTEEVLRLEISFSELRTLGCCLE